MAGPIGAGADTRRALEEQASLILTGTASPCTSDCTPVFALYGLPSIPGTCTSTGYQSIGKFSMSSVSQSHQGGDQSPKDNSQANSNGEGHQGFSINGTYSTTNTTFVASDEGTWRWLVSYAGDANNLPTTSACGVENFTIRND